jgi:ATP-dependent helicase/nuclease subunit B
VYEGKKEAPKAVKELLLWQAYSECDSKGSVGFDREFLKFLSTSEFLFKFFSELNGERVSLDTLDMSDTYAQFEEHIAVLRRVGEAYKRRLDAFGYYDRAFETKIELNELFFASYEECEFYIEGIPRNDELEIFEQISHIANTTLFFAANKFTHKLLKKLRALGFDTPDELQGYFSACFDGKIVSKIADAKALPKPLFAKFGEETYQAGFVFWRVEELVASGVKPEDICVVLPDESFAGLLGSFDTKRNLNFAMGAPFTGAKYYQKLSSLFAYMSEGSTKAKSKCESYFGKNSPFLGLDSNKYISATEFEELLDTIDIEDDETSQIVKDAIFELKNCFIVSELDFKSALKLLLVSLAKKSTDDVGGGKVTVMGPLEARGASFRAVIVVDFNEGKVPKPQDKDLFLNSKIRQICGLPTMFEREELQSYFYLSLFENAEFVSICFVENERQSGSRALRWLDCTPCEFGDLSAKKVLSTLLAADEPFAPQVVQESYKIEKFSASSLTDYLTCKRKYLFKHIKKIKEHDVGEEVKAYEMGTMFHDAAKDILCESYDGAGLGSAFTAAFMSKCGGVGNEELRFLAKSAIGKLSKFFEYERERVKSVKIYAVEKGFEFELEGFLFSGRIDRIDIGADGGYEIIDYKLKKSVKVDSVEKVSKKPEGVSDFQLAIYVLGLASLTGIPVAVLLDNNFDGAFFYDVFKASLLKEDVVEAKLELLGAVLKNIKKDDLSLEDLCQTPKLSSCHHCAYNGICGR